MELLKKIAVRVKGIDNSKGTGFIYNLSSEKHMNYIITAQHCLTEDRSKRVFTSEEMQKIEIYDYKGERILISNVHIPENEELDFSVIETVTCEQYPSILIKNPSLHDEYSHFGFPKYLEGDSMPGELMFGQVIDLNGNKIILQHQNKILSDGDRDAKENTQGFSGSALVNKSNKLIGILISLRGKGSHGRLVGISIEEVNNFIISIGLEPLSPYELSDFDIYFNNILESEGKEFGPIIKKRYQNYISEIKPIYIQEKLKEKLFLPYEEEGNALDYKIWEGWIRLLIYISLGEDEKIDSKNLNNHIYIEDPTLSQKRLFFTKENRIQKIVGHLYSPNVYKDIQDNDVIFVNSEKLFGPHNPNEDKLHKIVRTIDDPYTYESGIDVTKPEELKKFKLIHLDYLVSQIEEELIECLDAKMNYQEIEKVCSSKIKGLL